MKRAFTINDYINMLLAHIKLIIILPFICALLSYCYTVFLITPVYSTNMLLYVKNTDAASHDSDSDVSYKNNETSSDGTNTRVSPYDMSTSARIADTCSLLFKTAKFMGVVLSDDQIELERSYSPAALKNSVTFESVEESQVMKVTVNSMSPRDTVQICDAIFRQAETYYKNYFPTGQIFMVEEAVVPSSPISPNLNTNIIYGFIAGLAVAVGISFLIGFIDTTIKPSDDLHKMYNIPVFAEIININT